MISFPTKEKQNYAQRESIVLLTLTGLVEANLIASTIIPHDRKSILYSFI
jgi:hypothetical protein